MKVLFIPYITWEQGRHSLRNRSYADSKAILISHTFERVLLRDASCGLLISSTDSNNCSTKQDAVKQAEVLGISIRTMERWLLELVQSADIERIGQGIYKMWLWKMQVRKVAHLAEVADKFPPFPPLPPHYVFREIPEWTEWPEGDIGTSRTSDSSGRKI